MKPNEYKVNISKEKFTLVNENKVLRDKELITKPVGFFKDAFYRFTKNKGSVTGAIVVGILILYAILAPIFSPYSVEYNDATYRFALPKVFNNIDFIDGCADKTNNKEMFLYYYSMGEETGHYALKNQEYTVKNLENGENMYSYRLDSYQSPGVIFKEVEEKDYFNIQEYQDKYNRQVIYPITDRTKRPQLAQNLKDANYWFATKEVSSKVVADQYTINEDGTVSFTNIYSPYAPSSLSTKSSNQTFNPSAFYRFVDGGSGTYIVELMSANSSGEYTSSNKYIASNINENDDFYFSYDTEIANASKFKIDATTSALVLNISNYQDSTKNGDYFLSIPSERGSAISLQKLDLIDDPNYVPLVVVDKNNGLLVSDVTLNNIYCLSCIKDSFNTITSYIDSLMALFGTTGGFGITNSLNGSALVSVTPQDGGYTLAFSKNGSSIKTYSAVVTNADDSHSLGTASSLNPASVYIFDETKNSFYVELNNHTDASKNGKYYLASKIPNDPSVFNVVNSTNYSVVIAKAEEIDNDEYLDYYRLVDKTTSSVVTVIDPSLTYKLSASKVLNLKNHFLLDGKLKGDNYFSKMRIEGEDQYDYAYANNLENGSYEIRINYYEYYSYYHTYVLKDGIKEPSYLFGATASGQDLFTCLASGARFSFMLAIVVAVVNMIVGAIYGAIEGYYGGKIDLVMERIVEILSAVPFMIVITLLRYHMKGTSQALILFIAFFLTGWIGMSATVRMQFYRFKNQEYVLAARTLGAKDWRIMFKHIFPNSLGTIVTSSVLVIPGMIFSETSLSYLGIINLNTGKLTSVGTLLANGQPYLVNYPHIILFPAIFISLLMLSFNLFGNGLRDAFNPSLRGTED